MNRLVFTKKLPKVKRLTFSGGRQKTSFVRLNVRKGAENFKEIPDTTCLQSTSTATAISPSLEPPVTVTSGADKLGNYAEKKQKVAEAWESIRKDLLAVRTEELAPASLICQKCGVHEDEIIHCLDCSRVAYYCHQCNTEIHKTVLFHVPNKWTGKMFVPLTLREKPTMKRLDHSCEAPYIRELAVVDVKGIQHVAKFTFCSCERETLTLLRYGLWAATPEKPVVAFSLEYMELITVLQLESQLSVKSFCEAMECIQNMRINDVKEVKNIYRTVVGDSQNEYRFHRTVFTNGKHLDCGIVHGTCPACCKNAGRTVICMDANFGLVHKRSAGTQEISAPRHVTDHFIHDQRDVDLFLSTYQDSKNEGCASFQAGNALRSKIKNSKLDITGVFGTVCKHDHPLKLCNLRHGERLGYSVYHLEKQLQDTGEGRQIILMYDIACMLHRHLQKNNRTDLLEQTIFTVPVFHSFAHNMQCQLLYGQRHVDGIGLTDGEGIERLWSFLRRFSRITKEMTLTNRQDLLVDALHHYSKKLNTKLVDRIVSRYTKAVSLKTASLDELKKETDKDVPSVKELYEERKRLARGKQLTQDAVSVTKEEEYNWLLFCAHLIRKDLELGNTCDETRSSLIKDLEGTENKLVKLEKKLKITERWTISDSMLTSYKSKRKTALKNLMKGLAIERQFLLSSMKKYADGQDIAIRLGKQLKLVAEKLKARLMDYNQVAGTSIQIQDVSNTSSEFYDNPTDVQHENKILDLYSNMQRAEEEISLSVEDMKSTLSWFHEQQSVIDEQITEYDSQQVSQRSDKGKLNLLLFLQMQTENCLLQAADKFSPYIDSGFDISTPVINYVFQCLKPSMFEESVPDVIAESLELIDFFESGNTDEQDEIDEDDLCGDNLQEI